MNYSQNRQLQQFEGTLFEVSNGVFGLKNDEGAILLDNEGRKPLTMLSPWIKKQTNKDGANGQRITIGLTDIGQVHSLTLLEEHEARLVRISDGVFNLENDEKARLTNSELEPLILRQSWVEGQISKKAVSGQKVTVRLNAQIAQIHSLALLEPDVLKVA